MTQTPDLGTLRPENLLELARKRAQAVAQSKGSLYAPMDVADWIQTHFMIPEVRGPMPLAPHQIALLRHIFHTNPDGTWNFSTVVWGDIKKSIKSCVAAAVALYLGYQREWSQVYAVANDLKQANSRVGYYLRRAIELNPAMKGSVRMRNYHIQLPNHSTIEAIPIDPSGEAGSNADLVVFSELWGANQEAQSRMWTEMTLPPTKYGRSMRWIETYAGYAGESTLLEQLYFQGKQGDPVLLSGFEPGDLELTYYAPARLLMWWNTRPRLPWQTPAYYAQEAATLAPSEFQRVHRNQFVSATETFVPEAWWRACHRPKPSMAVQQPLVFALDAAVSNDSFGIVGVSRHGIDIAVRYARKWSPPAHGTIDFSEIEAEIRRLAKEYNVVEWAYDPYQLHDLATRLQREHVGWFRPFAQNTERAIADKQLFTLIRDRRLYHDDEPDLTAHVLNANSQVVGENRLRLVKRSPALKIDLAVCLSMSSAEALRLNLG